MKLAALESLPAFALLGPGFSGGDAACFGTLRATDRAQTRSGRGPQLIFAPYDSPGTGARVYPLDAASPLEAGDLLRELRSLPPSPLAAAFETSDLDAYASSIETIRNSIAAGDVYQVNFALRASIALAASSQLPASIGIAGALLRRGVPAHFAWVRFPDGGEFISGSPELFFAIEGATVRCEPMKGTAAPGEEAWLRESEKDRAELSMITDLMRNDLTPVCLPGSVRVVCERRFLRLPYAVQAVSDIEGTLRPEASALEVLAALHPCGSVTGAPKRAAMEAIAKLERHPRRAYCGSLGLVTNERARFSVLIRTAQREGDAWSYSAGGGIVWQSNAADELRELQLKLGAIR